MKPNTIAFFLVIAISTFSIPTFAAITCEKAEEMYGNNEMSREERDKICDKKAPAPQATAESPTPPRQRTGRRNPTGNGQQPPAPPTDKPVPEDKIADLTKSLEAIQKDVAATKSQMSLLKNENEALKNAQNEGAWAKMWRSGLIGLTVELLIVALLAYLLKNYRLIINGLAALNRKIDAQRGGRPPP